MSLKIGQKVKLKTFSDENLSFHPIMQEIVDSGKYGRVIAKYDEIQSEFSGHYYVIEMWDGPFTASSGEVCDHTWTWAGRAMTEADPKIIIEEFKDKLKDQTNWMINNLFKDV